MQDQIVYHIDSSEDCFGNRLVMRILNKCLEKNMTMKSIKFKAGDHTILTLYNQTTQKCIEQIEALRALINLEAEEEDKIRDENPEEYSNDVVNRILLSLNIERNDTEQEEELPATQ